MYVIIKNKLFIIVFLFVSFGFSQEKMKNNKSEQMMNLNGNWKFNAIYGEGSNYNNIKASSTDVVVDNLDINQIKVKGEWTTTNVEERGSGFYKDNYLKHFFKDKTDKSSVIYIPNLPTSGYYEAFVRFPFAINLNTKVNIQHANGIDTQYFNQRNRCDEWLSLGIFTFEKDKENGLEITSDVYGVSVSADAVLFRPVSKEKIISAEKEKKTVFLNNFDDTDWYNLKVPGHYGMINDFSNYTGKAWYRKTFTTPDKWTLDKNEKIRLKFDGVYHIAKVYLNGKFIGEHKGGFTPFEIDVTKNVELNKPNVLAVETNNNALVGATWNWGGIIRDVTLVKNNDVRITHNYIHAYPDLDKGTASLELKIRIENSGSTDRVLDLKTNIYREKQLQEITKKVIVKANSTKELFLKSSLKAKDVKLWHFDRPYLYKMQHTLLDNGTEVHTVNDRFGIRKIELTDKNLFLNGEAVRLAGYNRVSDHRYWGSSEPQEIINKDVDLMKNAGANFMRIMHGTQNRKLIERCDEKGILLFEEVNVRDLDNSEFTAPNYPLVKSWVKEMVERDSNSPSIIGWSVGNELTGHNAYATMMMNYVRELDAHRLVTCVSNTGSREEATPATDPNTNTDIIMHNHYSFQGTAQSVLSAIRNKWPNKSIFISEYGVDRLKSTSLDEDLPKASDLNDNLRGKNEFVIGASLWTYNDYRSGYIGTSEEENRTWGIVNAWRQKRRFYTRMQKENSPVKDIKVTFNKTKAAIVIPIKERNNYPSFTMVDYKLVWNLKDANGTVISSETKKLPVLQPEDAVWEGQIKLPKSIDKAVVMHIALVSSNGYTRFEKTIALQKPEKPTVTSIVAGKNETRVYFNEVVAAEEYFISYTNSKGETVKTEPTIANFIEVKDLQLPAIKANLIAVNSLGESLPQSVELKNNQQKLPPVVWQTFIRDNYIIVGYSGELNDESYTVRYGTSKDKLLNIITTYTRGMMTIPIMKLDTYFLQIKRKDKNGDSNWSPVITVKKN